MLDTSALIGLYEADHAVRTYLADLLGLLDDGTPATTHAVVLGELWTGVLAFDHPEDPDNPRRRVLEAAAQLVVETIGDTDPELFAGVTVATNRTMSHNDRWISVAAMRTRCGLVTQDANLAEQLSRYLASLSAVKWLQHGVPIYYVPRDTATLPELGSASLPTFAPDEIESLTAMLEPDEATVVGLRLGLGSGTPRTEQEVAAELEIARSQVAAVEALAIERLRATRRLPR